MLVGIIVKNKVEFIHRYISAPEEVAFLREYHRHEAHIETEIEVYHDDRELEFILVKDYIDSLLEHEIDMRYVDKSCEMVAKEIIAKLIQRYGDRGITCKVFEDDENGAVVRYTGQQ